MIDLTQVPPEDLIAELLNRLPNAAIMSYVGRLNNAKVKTRRPGTGRPKLPRCVKCSRPRRTLPSDPCEHCGTIWGLKAL